MLIYPISYTMLGREQFGAVAEAAASVGDATAYLVPYGSLEADWAGTYDHRLVALEYTDYELEGTLVLEHLLYSPEGKWGVVTSHGDFALVGGTQTVIDAVRGGITADEELMTRAFVRDWRDIGRRGGEIGWLLPLLVHLYGEARTHELWSTEPGDAE
ncbi:MAG: hypothetical protein WKF41_05660 [Gaiellaceae bacterium]